MKSLKEVMVDMNDVVTYKGKSGKVVDVKDGDAWRDDKVKIKFGDGSTEWVVVPNPNVKVVRSHAQRENTNMKLEQLKSVIKEEVHRAINERRIVRNEVRRAISEALPKLGSGKRFKNLTKKLAAKEAVASIKNKKEAVVPNVKREAAVAQPAALSPTARLMPKPNKPPKAIKESFKSIISRIVREELEEAKVRNPKALAAWIGRKKFGKGKFQKMAAAGRRKH